MKHNFAVKTNASIVFKQASVARRFALSKSRRQFKHEPSEKKAYVPGYIGLSAVSDAIDKEYGGILNRTGRKLLAKTRREARPRFYSHQ